MNEQSASAIAMDKLSELYTQYAKGLLAYIHIRIHDLSLAEDILHDVFVLYARQSAVTNIQHPRSYLYRSAQRLLLNKLRDRAADTWHAERAREVFIGREPEPRSAEQKLEESAAAGALAALPDEEQCILAMRVYGELTFEEISNVLEMPLSTVFRRYESVIATLRRTLQM